MKDGTLRTVKPYYFQYKTHVKQRWEGRTLPQVFETEFGQTPQSISDDINRERLRLQAKDKNTYTVIQGEQLKSYRLRQHDVILNSKHVHEPPVPFPNGADIEILHADSSLIVVNKPSGVPTHPTGNYRYNTVTEMIKAQMNVPEVFACHRLDKATSGVLLLTTNSSACASIQKQLQSRQNVEKSYLARVKGEFPPSTFSYQSPIFLLNSTAGYIMPSKIVPSASRTLFTRLQYNKDQDESIVSCEPQSGKMHQIRIHLRNLGHPIVNDRLYNPSQEDKLNDIRNSIEQRLYQNVFDSGEILDSEEDSAINVAELSKLQSDVIQQDIKKLSELRRERLVQLKLSNSMCEECHLPIIESTVDGELWLHAKSYKVVIANKNCMFIAEAPSWAYI